MGIDYKRIGLLLICAIIALVGCNIGQPLIHGNKEAINVIVTVFSILAGFLVAITTIMGDPSILLPGSWRIAEQQRSSIENKLNRQQLLFYLYLITLLLIFIAALLPDESKCHALFKVMLCPQKILEKTYLFCAIFGFLVSFSLPTSLSRIQMDRVDAIIDARKKKK